MANFTNCQQLRRRNGLFFLSHKQIFMDLFSFIALEFFYDASAEQTWHCSLWCRISRESLKGTRKTNPSILPCVIAFLSMSVLPVHECMNAMQHRSENEDTRTIFKYMRPVQTTDYPNKQPKQETNDKGTCPLGLLFSRSIYLFPDSGRVFLSQGIGARCMYTCM